MSQQQSNNDDEDVNKVVSYDGKLVVVILRLLRLTVPL
jgi:hypothetical protein